MKKYNLGTGEEDAWYEGPVRPHTCIMWGIHPEKILEVFQVSAPLSKTVWRFLDDYKRQNAKRYPEYETIYFDVYDGEPLGRGFDELKQTLDGYVQSENIDAKQRDRTIADYIKAIEDDVKKSPKFIGKML